MHNRVKGGGAITGSHQLREKYLPEVYTDSREELKAKIAQHNVSVIFDKFPDVEGRCVLNILISPLVKQGENKIIPYLANTAFMDKCDHTNVSEAVIKTLNDIGVDSENVVSFNTDNTAYMLKAFKTILTHLFPIQSI